MTARESCTKLTFEYAILPGTVQLTYARFRTRYLLYASNDETGAVGWVTTLHQKCAWSRLELKLLRPSDGGASE